MTIVETFAMGLLVPLVELAADNAASTTIVSRWFPKFGDYSPVVRLQWIALLVVAAAALRGLLTFGNRWFSSQLQIAVEFDYRRSIFEDMLRSNGGFLNRQPVSYTFNVSTLDSGKTGLFARSTVNVLCGVIQMLLFACMLVLLSPMLTLVTVVSLISVVFVLKSFLHARLSRAGDATNRALVGLNTTCLEAISGSKVVQMNGRGHWIHSRFETAAVEAEQAARSRGRLLSLPGPLLNTAIGGVVGIVLLTSALLFGADLPSQIGRILLFLVIMSRLQSPAAMIQEAASNAANLYPSIQRMDEFQRQARRSILSPGTRIASSFEREIEFCDVSFRYGSSDPSVLENLSFTIRRNTVTAIVGPSGCGKSTTLALMGRLYDPTSGGIVIDGHDLRSLQIDSWRSQIAYVSQDTFLFNDTIRENLRFARDDVTDAEILEVARLSSVDEFVRGLPDGYDTVLGDRGTRLSGGQRQRLALARALLARPRLLILDEATSQLDSQTEQIVQDCIRVMSGRCTIIVVTHRLATIRDADQIIVIDNGTVSDIGRHDELIGRPGTYQRLATLQEAGQFKGAA